MNGFESTHWLNDHVAMGMAAMGRLSDANSWMDVSRVRNALGKDEPERTNPVFRPLSLSTKLARKEEHCRAIAALEGTIQEKNPWIVGNAAIRIGSSFSSLGIFAKAMEWASLAIAIGREIEDSSLLAYAFGLRGQILLRAGFPTRAFEAFSTDLAILQPGSPRRGTVLCFLAICLTAMGDPMAGPAEMGFRLAANHSSDRALQGFAWSCLAFHGASLGKATTVEEATSKVDLAPTPSNLFRLHIAKSLVANGLENKRETLEAALKAANGCSLRTVWIKKWSACQKIFLSEVSTGIKERIQVPTFEARNSNCWPWVTPFDHFPDINRLPEDAYSLIMEAESDRDIWRWRSLFLLG